MRGGMKIRLDAGGRSCRRTRGSTSSIQRKEVGRLRFGQACGTLRLVRKDLQPMAVLATAE